MSKLRANCSKFKPISLAHGLTLLRSKFFWIDAFCILLSNLILTHDVQIFINDAIRSTFRLCVGVCLLCVLSEEAHADLQARG